MSEWTRTIQLGDTSITLMNIGDIQLNLAEDYHLAEKDWPPGTTELFSQNVRMPMTCVLVETSQTKVLVDATVYEFAPGSRFPIPGFQPPPGLLARLAERNVKPDQIEHVVITHTHFDHYNGLTHHEDTHQPCFPNARHYLGQADWESDLVQDALKDADSLVSHTLGVVHNKGLLEFVAGNRNLTPEIQLIPAPGESPGHQIVRISAGGQIFYVLGDLYHHPVEVEHPEWMSWWADKAANLNSRQRLVEAALAENALLSAAHIPTLGRLSATATGAVWETATL